VKPALVLAVVDKELEPHAARMKVSMTTPDQANTLRRYITATSPSFLQAIR
jgi:hypothetical protein